MDLRKYLGGCGLAAAMQLAGKAFGFQFGLILLYNIYIYST